MQHVQSYADVYSVILQALLKLQQENTELKKQIKEMKTQETSSTVAERINAWLDKPYAGSSERSDVEQFASEITQFIESKLKT